MESLITTLPQFHVSASGGQWIGTREYQEDYIALCPRMEDAPAQHLLAVLADGMGGMGDGDKASRLIVNTFVKSHTEMGRDLIKSLSKANATIGELKRHGAITDGAGATFIAVEITEEGISWVSVGDSLLYLQKGDSIRKLNNAHTWEWELEQRVKMGKMTQAEADAAPGPRNALFAAVCGDNIEAVDIANPHSCEPGDRIIICSDGFSPLVQQGWEKWLNSPEIRQASARQARKALTAELQKLNRSNQDNASIIIIDIVSKSQDTPTASETNETKAPAAEEVEPPSVTAITEIVEVVIPDTVEIPARLTEEEEAELQAKDTADDEEAPPAAEHQQPVMEKKKARAATVSLLGDRNSQQDSEGCWQSANATLAVVADGAGGHAGGAQASRIAVDCMRKIWKEELAAGVSPEHAAATLTHAIKKAHETIIRKSGGKAALSGKCAIVVAYLSGGQYTVLNAGDCRCYITDNGSWKQLTTDDSLLRRLIESGAVTPEEAKDHPDQSVLTQALGGSGEVEPHVSRGTYTPQDSFLLCCDGLWNQLPDECWPLNKWQAMTGEEYQTCLEQMAQQAVKAADGKSDNVSAIWVYPKAPTVAAYTPPPAAEPTPTRIPWGGIAIGLLLIAALIGGAWVGYMQGTGSTPPAETKSPLEKVGETASPEEAIPPADTEHATPQQTPAPPTTEPADENPTASSEESKDKGQVDTHSVAEKAADFNESDDNQILRSQPSGRQKSTGAASDSLNTKGEPDKAPAPEENVRCYSISSEHTVAIYGEHYSISYDSFSLSISEGKITSAKPVYYLSF